MILPDIHALIDKYKEIEEKWNNCSHSFRRRHSVIELGHFAWQCTKCGQMRHEYPPPFEGEMSPEPDIIPDPLEGLI